VSNRRVVLARSETALVLSACVDRLELSPVEKKHSRHPTLICLPTRRPPPLLADASAPAQLGVPPAEPCLLSHPVPDKPYSAPTPSLLSCRPFFSSRISSSHRTSPVLSPSLGHPMVHSPPLWCTAVVARAIPRHATTPDGGEALMAAASSFAPPVKSSSADL
jgi:hypothetical protein